MRRILFIILTVFFLVLISISLFKNYQHYRILKQEVNRLTLELKNLNQEREKLEKLQQEGSQKEILEKWARTMMGMKKEGEQVVLVTPITNLNAITTTTSTTEKTTFNNSFNNFIENFKKIWYDFLENIRKTKK